MPEPCSVAAKNTMAYTVKQVAEMSGVSVRTLHFYDETGLLKPAFVGANGYRFYEEPQLLTLQQILFYRELGFELKQIGEILGSAEFELIAALESHRIMLQKNVARSRLLLETIDKTIQRLKGIKEMKSEEMFAGFSVGAGEARFGERITLGSEPNDCKVSAKDTGGAMCVFEFTGGGGGPRHLHYNQDEWIYVIEGEFDFQVGDQKYRLGPGGCVFIPRKVSHVWTVAQGKPGKVIDVYSPAGTMEEFFRELNKYKGKPQFHEALTIQQMHDFFAAYGMDLTGPPMLGKWGVDKDGRVLQLPEEGA